MYKQNPKPTQFTMIATRGVVFLSVFLSTTTTINKYTPPSVLASATELTAFNADYDYNNDDDNSLDHFMPQDENDDIVISQPTTPLHLRQAVDFRDLLLPPNESTPLGGTGKQPYGDMVSSQIWPLVQDMTNPESESYQNRYQFLQETLAPMMESFTNSTSGLLYDYHLDDMAGAKLNVQVSNLRIQNVTSILPSSRAMKLLQPIRDQPHVLSNRFYIGNQEQTGLEVSIRLGITIEGSSPLAMNNQVDLHLVIPPSFFDLDMVLLMDAIKFLQLPLDEVFNLACWANTLMDPSTKNKLSSHQAMELSKFKTTFASLVSINATCVSCSDHFGVFLPKLMAVLLNSYDPALFTERLEGVVEDAGTIFWDTIDITGMMQIAASQCPESSSYQPNNNLTAPAAAPLDLFQSLMNADILLTNTTVSKETIETLLGMGFIGMETTTLIAAQKYASVVPPPAVEVPWSAEVNNSFLDWRVLEDPLKSLRAQVERPEFVLGLVQSSNLYDADKKSLTIPFLQNVSLDTSLGYTISLDHVDILGIDSLVNLTIAKSVGPYTLQSELKFERLEIELELFIQSNDNDDELMEIENSEVLAMSIQVHDLLIAFDLVLPINLELLGDLTLGTLLLEELSESIPSLLAALPNAPSIQTLNVTIASIDYPYVEGYFSQEMKAMVNSVSQSLFQTFGDYFPAALPNLCQTVIRQDLNQYIQQEYDSFFNRSTSQGDKRNDGDEVFVGSADGFVDFQALLLGRNNSSYGTLFYLAYASIRNSFFNEEGAAKINDMIASWTEEQSNTSGTLEFPNSKASANATFQIGNLDATSQFRVWNITLRGLDSVAMPLSLLFPTDPHVLESQVSVGTPNPIILGANFMFAISDGEEMDIHNELRLELRLDNITAAATMLLQLTETALMSFPLKDTDNIHCWLALLPPTTDSIAAMLANPIPGIAVEGRWRYQKANLDLNCSSCTSPQFPELIEHLYRTGENLSDVIESAVNRVADGELFGSVLNYFLSNAREQCPHIRRNVTADQTILKPESSIIEEAVNAVVRDPKSRSFHIGVLAFAGAVLLVFVLCQLYVHFRNKAWRKSLSKEGDKLLQHVLDSERKRDIDLDQTMTSLYHSIYIPAHTRLMVPILLFINMGLFAVAHAATSFTLAVDVQLAGDEFSINRMFEFNFMDGLRNTYKSGGWEMAILLLIFGGIFPYFKGAVSMMLWFAPPRWISSNFRGQVLLWIDAMNKLTVRDIFKILVILGIVFVYVGGPHISSQATGNLYGMKVIAVLGPALYCGITAMILSRTSSKWLLDYHNEAMDQARKAYYDHQNQLSSAGCSVEGTDSNDSCPHKDVSTTLNGDDHSELADRVWHFEGISDRDDMNYSSEEIVQGDDDVSTAPSEISVRGHRRHFSMWGQTFSLGDLAVWFGVVAILCCRVSGSFEHSGTVPRIGHNLRTSHFGVWSVFLHLCGLATSSCGPRVLHGLCGSGVFTVERTCGH